MKAHVLTTIAFTACTVFAGQVYAQDTPATPVVAEEAQPAVAGEAQPATVEEQIALCREKMQEFATLLEGVKDPESAAAAAPKAKELFKELEELADSLEAVVTEEANADLFELDARIFDLAEALEQLPTPWHGCKELAQVFGSMEEEEIEYPDDHMIPEQEEYYSKAVETMHKETENMLQQLSQVKDKASADAAAQKIRQSLDTIQNILEESFKRDDFTPAVENYMESHLNQAKRELDQLMQLTSEISAQHFYGSQALEEVLMLLTGD